MHARYSLPAGDTLTRKSFYEALLAGCIPVVFRSDGRYLEQLAFPDQIPYAEMWISLKGEHLTSGALDVYTALKSIPHGEFDRSARTQVSWPRVGLAERAAGP